MEKLTIAFITMFCVLKLCSVCSSLLTLQSVGQLKLAANCLKAVHRYDLFRLLNIYLWLNHINSIFSINVIARHTTQCYGLDMNSKEVAMVKQINISIISVNQLVCFLCNESGQNHFISMRATAEQLCGLQSSGAAFTLDLFISDMLL